MSTTTPIDLAGTNFNTSAGAVSSGTSPSETPSQIGDMLVGEIGHDSVVPGQNFTISNGPSGLGNVDQQIDIQNGHGGIWGGDLSLSGSTGPTGTLTWQFPSAATYAAATVLLTNQACPGCPAPTPTPSPIATPSPTPFPIADSSAHSYLLERLSGRMIF